MNILLNHEPLTVHFGCHIDSCDIKEVLLQEHLFCLIMSQGVKGMKASSSDILDNDDSMLLLSEIIETQQKKEKSIVKILLTKICQIYFKCPSNSASFFVSNLHLLCFFFVLFYYVFLFCSNGEEHCNLTVSSWAT